MLMSALAEEKGGKSEKMPTLMAPALVMSSTASALACVARPAPRMTAAVITDFNALRRVIFGSPAGSLFVASGRRLQRGGRSGLGVSVFLDRRAEHHQAE